jgi:hypothetical protein
VTDYFELAKHVTDVRMIEMTDVRMIGEPGRSGQPPEPPLVERSRSPKFWLLLTWAGCLMFCLAVDAGVAWAVWKLT